MVDSRRQLCYHALALALALALPVLPFAAAQAADEPTRSGDIVPRPDPTALTTSQLLREIASLQREITSLQKLLESRLDSMQQATALLQSKADKLPSEVDVKIAGLKELFTEKFRGQESLFSGINLQFKERDERVAQLSLANTAAINAALQAQKEQFAQQNSSFDKATQKAEAAFNEQIKQMAALIQTETRALDGKISIGTKVADEKISTINERLTRVEAMKAGVNEAQGDANMSSTLLISIMGIVVSIIAVGVALVMAFRRREESDNHRHQVA